jgi:prefoldin subunit 5
MMPPKWKTFCKLLSARVRRYTDFLSDLIGQNKNLLRYTDFIMDKLQEANLEAIKLSRERLEKWEKFESDYKILQERLVTLPKKLTHKIMVPLTPVAYMEGEMYRTNEVLVLLGDNWFCERSSYQAYQIVERRMDYIEREMEKERKVLDHFKERSRVTGNVQNLEEGVVDIREEYDEVTEQQWKRNRKERRKKDRQMKSDDLDVWKRLDELEIEEEKEAERQSECETTGNIFFTHTQTTDRQPETHSTVSETETHSGPIPKFQSPADIVSEERNNSSPSGGQTPSSVHTKKSIKWNISEAEKKPAAVKPKHSMPFTGQVIERNVTNLSNIPAVDKEVEPKTKKVSKFKASQNS